MKRGELKHLLRPIAVMMVILVGLPVLGWLATRGLMFAACQFNHQCV